MNPESDKKESTKEKSRVKELTQQFENNKNKDEGAPKMRIAKSIRGVSEKVEAAEEYFPKEEDPCVELEAIDHEEKEEVMISNKLWKNF